MNIPTLKINTTNNLLAFSAGIDSTALFFLMMEEEILFDIAIVDYNQRLQSKDEVIYATQLAHKYNKKCFVSSYPVHNKFNEKDAREYRYDFFKKIINKHNYNSLITAHQLNDNLEWFLMQFTKGAGLTELIGMQEYTVQDNYQIIKPLLKCSKKSLQKYLDDRGKKYFIDESNYDEKYKRNFFRHNFSDKLLEEFEAGILKSFNYLNIDNESLFKNIKEVKINELSMYEYKNDINIAIRIIDKNLKERGILISNGTREEIKNHKEVVVSHKIAIALTNDKIYIAPVTTQKMNKKFKEKCRINKIPKNIRAYIFKLEEEQLFILESVKVTV